MVLITKRPVCSTRDPIAKDEILPNGQTVGSVTTKRAMCILRAAGYGKAGDGFNAIYDDWMERRNGTQTKS